MADEISRPNYKTLRYWGKQYGRVDQTDQKAALEFALVEPDYLLKSLKSDLHAVFKGNFEDKVLNDFIGLKRKVKHGSYEDWARLMLIWLASYKR